VDIIYITFRDLAKAERRRLMEVVRLIGGIQKKWIGAGFLRSENK
jgi:hypothetical protein